MALVKEITRRAVPAGGTHLPVECTFDVVLHDGTRYLQLDTYGSRTQQRPGKKSQSLRLTPAAIAALKQILSDHGL